MLMRLDAASRDRGVFMHSIQVVMRSMTGVHLPGSTMSTLNV